MIAYSVAARANAVLFAEEAGRPMGGKPARGALERLGRGAASAGRDGAARPLKFVDEIPRLWGGAR